MATEEEPRQKTVETEQEYETRDAMSLVDLFDQMDRAAFQRSLAHRDAVRSHGTES